MSLFGKLLKSGFDLVTTPVEIVKDVVTLGGAMTEKQEPYTVQRLRRLAADAEEVREELEEL
jgi:hypothetical protein